jgi:hypothetical protein
MRKDPPVPAVMSEEGLHGQELRWVRKNNNILESVRASSTKLGILIAEVRWLVLEMGRKQHAEAADIHYHAQKNAEEGGLKVQHKTYENIAAFWESHKEVTQETRELFLRLLVERQYAVRGEEEIPPEEPRELSIFDLYRRWGYMRGHGALFRHVKTPGSKTPFTEGGLWQRRAEGVVPEWQEIERVWSRLHLPREERELAQHVWMNAQQRQSTERGIAPAYAHLLMSIERSGTQLAINALAKRFSISQELAGRLSGSRPVRLEEAEPIARQVMIETELEEWRASWDRTQEVPPGERMMEAYVRVRDLRGLTNEHISKAMQLPGAKPSQHLRHTLENLSPSSVAPAGVILGLAAGKDLDPDTHEPHAAQLRSLFVELRRSMLKASGLSIAESDLRLQRDYWGIETETLAQAALITGKELQLIEQGKKQVPQETLRRLQQLAEAMGKDKLDEAQRQLTMRTQEKEKAASASPRSLQECSEVLAKRVGGYLGLERLIQNPDQARDTMSVQTLKAIGVGKRKTIPPLCMLQRLIYATGAELLPEFVDDWYRHYPAYLMNRTVQRGWHPPKTPLGRAFAVTMAARWPNTSKFHKEMMDGVIGYATFVRNLQFMNDGKDIPWPTVERCFLSLGLSPEDPLYIYVQSLVQAEGNITEALTRWRNIAKQMGIQNTREHEKKFGLLPREAPDVWA